MDLHEAITEARENIVAHFSTEPCVVNALLSEIDRLSAELCAIKNGQAARTATFNAVAEATEGDSFQR